MTGIYDYAGMLLLASTLLFGPLVSAEDFYGYVRFYDYAKFSDSGAQYYYYTSDSHYCINLSCFNDKTTSVKWKNLPSNDGKSKIVFFTGKNCTGTKREWNIDSADFPYDFSKDGVDNDISSFIIYESGTKNKGNVLPCPWGSNLF